MKTSDIKKKVAAKVGKGKDKVEKKCGKGAKCAAILFAIGLATALFGCSTADAPTAQRAQTVTVTDNSFVFNFGQSEPCATNRTVVVPSFHFEFGTAALDDLKVTPDELTAVCNSFRIAYAAWRAE